jgi:cellulose synthase/poly-beta-1,6-N-acetylglucosamine synthase-like glycosyltransferase
LFWYIYIPLAVLAFLSQALFLWQSRRNYYYALTKAEKEYRYPHRPVLLTVPCKGIDNSFEKNITSILMLEYDDYVLHFVVEDASDPAYAELQRLREKLCDSSKAKGISILIAGRAAGSSQKIHNLLHSCRNAPADVEVFAFADSDACLQPRWLQHLVYPLRKEHYGASTGYRWFVPETNNLASLAMSAINAKIAQLLGNTIFNQLWGGSMAITAETFRQVELEEVWQKAIADDLSLSHAIRKVNKRIIFAPGCMVPSYEKATWKSLFEFARRQFVITRVTLPRTWWFGLFCITYSLGGLWGAAAIAIYAATQGIVSAALCAPVPVLFFTGQIYRAVLRQKMIARLLPQDAARMKTAALADIAGTFLWSWALFVFILASAFGRTITWRGIRYRLMGPTTTIVIPPRKT